MDTCTQTVPTEWTITHGNGSTERFFPSDSRYSHYVAGNGVCEDLRACVESPFDGPHCGIFWYGDFIDDWYGNTADPFLFENVTGPLVKYPWTLDMLLHQDIDGDCDPGTDCTDCSSSPPPPTPPSPPRCEEGCAQVVSTNWSIFHHGTGKAEEFLPSDPRYAEYVSGNGICEDISSGDFTNDPYGGSHFYAQKPDDVSHYQWYGDDVTLLTSYIPHKNATITYPWTASDIFHGSIGGAQCSPGTDCTDCATNPPP